MMNAIESPEFCKECPFNLYIEEINNLIQSNNLIKKCKERRCVINSKNYEILEKNENDFYEYICNYDPTSEFDEVKETNDMVNNNVNIKNNTEDNNSDDIKCNKIDKNNLILSDLENNFVFNFYDKCNIYSDFYACERSKAPNKFDLGENFVCPEKNYMNKLITFCMLNIILNLVVNFLPFKLEYNKYVEMISPPRITHPKSNSFNSTINSSKLPKDNIETDDKFEPSPTEILIVVNNKNKNNINNIKQENNNNNNKEIKNEKNDENNINNELNIKKIRTRYINIHAKNEFKKIKQNDKEFKSTKNMRTVKNRNFIKKLEDEEKKGEKMSSNTEDENKITLSNDDNTISTKRIILGDDKGSD